MRNQGFPLQSKSTVIEMHTASNVKGLVRAMWRTLLSEIGYRKRGLLCLLIRTKVPAQSNTVPCKMEEAEKQMP